MTGKDQHVVSHKNDWAVRAEGSKKVTKTFDSKKEAEAFARRISKNQNSELVIHNRDGKIARKDSHGYDPCPPKDKY